MMIAITLLLVGAGIAIVSAGIGWLVGRRVGRTATRQALPTGAVCSCGHGYGTHEDERTCRGSDARKRNGLHHLDPCPCRYYDGPEPLPRVWGPDRLINM